VAGIANVIPFMILKDSIAKNEYNIKVSSNIQMRIHPKISMKYTLIVKELQERNINFHTYERNGKEKSFKVVLKSIHLSINPEELK